MISCLLITAFLWVLLMFGLLRDRLRSPIRRSNVQPPFYIPHFKKHKKGLIAESGDLKAIGKASLFSFFAAFVFSLQLEAIPDAAPGTYLFVRAYAVICSIAMGGLWIFLAFAFMRSRSEHSRGETFATYYWKVPVAIGFCAYRLLDRFAHEHLVNVQSRFLKKGNEE